MTDDVTGTPLNQRPPSWRHGCGTYAERLFAPVDAASLAVLRIAYGALMVWEVWRYWRAGWITEYFVTPTFFFRYAGFEWLPAPSPAAVYWLWGLMAAAAAGVALGLWYRVSAAVLTLVFTYFFLLDASNYLNHFYLICLLGGLLTFVPAHRIWSLDAWRRSRREQTVPAWTVWLFRFQVGVPYFFGGVAKLERDWLLGIPMRDMLLPKMHLPIVGPYLLEWWVADVFAFGGLLFDLLIVPFLVWKRTRVPAFIVCVLFHLTNKLLLNIGIFPWMMIGATTIFFEPDWPRRLPWIGRRRAAGPNASPPLVWTTSRRCVVAALAAWVLVQTALPLRHYFYAGSTSWTEIGHRFSWRMKLRTKEAIVLFYLVDPRTGEAVPFDASPYVTRRQIGEMSQHPDMILQFGRFLGEQLDAVGYGQHEVRAEAWCSLNGRDPQLLIDPAVDLSQQRRGVDTDAWIMPLEEPLGPRQRRGIEAVRALRARVQSSLPSLGSKSPQRIRQSGSASLRALAPASVILVSSRLTVLRDWSANNSCSPASVTLEPDRLTAVSVGMSLSSASLSSPWDALSRSTLMIFPSGSIDTPASMPFSLL